MSSVNVVTKKIPGPGLKNVEIMLNIILGMVITNHVKNIKKMI